MQKDGGKKGEQTGEDRTAGVNSWCNVSNI